MSCHDSFFLNETATTEIYTYCHTLSLHDALPILTLIPHSVIIRRLMSDTMRMSDEAPVVMRSAPKISSSAIRPPQATLRRSEEHTSELQSLMRISYAVFCLKKKMTKDNNKRRT